VAIDCSTSATRSCSCSLPSTRSPAFKLKRSPTCSGSDAKDDPSAALRKARFNLRTELRRLAPEVIANPLPANAYQGEKVVTLDISVVSSDVQEFS
jgi:hypothetical protein